MYFIIMYTVVHHHKSAYQLINTSHLCTGGVSIHASLVFAFTKLLHFILIILHIVSEMQFMLIQYSITMNWIGH